MAHIDENGTLHCNEFDLHDWIVGVLHTHNIDGNPCNEDGMGDYFCGISLKPIGYGNMKEGSHIVIDEKERKELEDAADKLIQEIQDFDAKVHDLCEYSC